LLLALRGVESITILDVFAIFADFLAIVTVARAMPINSGGLCLPLTPRIGRCCSPGRSAQQHTCTSTGKLSA
jgi:hypothetical protein